MDDFLLSPLLLALIMGISPPPLSLPRHTMHMNNAKICEIRFRVPYWMKEDFHKHCGMQDVPAPHLLRQFICEILATSNEAIR